MTSFGVGVLHDPRDPPRDGRVSERAALIEGHVVADGPVVAVSERLPRRSTIGTAELLVGGVVVNEVPTARRERSEPPYLLRLVKSQAKPARGLARLNEDAPRPHRRLTVTSE